MSASRRGTTFVFPAASSLQIAFLVICTATLSVNVLGQELQFMLVPSPGVFTYGVSGVGVFPDGAVASIVFSDVCGSQYCYDGYPDRRFAPTSRCEAH